MSFAKSKIVLIAFLSLSLYRVVKPIVLIGLYLAPRYTQHWNRYPDNDIPRVRSHKTASQSVTPAVPMTTKSIFSYTFLMFSIKSPSINRCVIFILSKLQAVASM
jgi:hypothetical protein